MNDRIYFDNAATTPIDPAVVDAMLPYLTTYFGNPSSIYSYGRESRLAIENARKTVARILNAHPAEVFFTSGGTESSNTSIHASVRDLGCRHIITSQIEHHATLHTVQHLQKQGAVQLSYVDLLPSGQVDLQSLESLLKNSAEKCLVTLMHANNEIGTLLDLHAAGNICRAYNAFFHCDTVQTVGHYPFDLRHTPVDFITGAAHKFHGPKGAGLLYIRQDVKIQPFVYGGSQERNMRAGTENVYGIVGFAKALELATARYDEDSAYIKDVKLYMLQQLREEIPSVTFNGSPESDSLYTVLSVNFPRTEVSDMILFNMDINNICVSGGSACSSGADVGSHVMQALHNDPDAVTVRFSFSRHNTRAEVDRVVQKLKSMI